MIPTGHRRTLLGTALPTALSTALLAAPFALWSCAHSTPGPAPKAAADEQPDETIGFSSAEPPSEDESTESEEPTEEEPSVEEQLALQAIRQSLEADQRESDEGGAEGADGESPADAASLKFRVVQQGPEQPWVMGVVNDGSDEVELVADPRLLRFEVKVPGKKKLVTCRLPADLFPKRAHARYRVLLEPGQGVVKAFDPRLYCFASTGQHVLVPGAIVTPSFGWPEKTKTVWRHGKAEKVKLPQEAPFVAEVTRADEQSDATEKENADDGDLAQAKTGEEKETGIKTLSSNGFSLDSEYRKWSAVGLPEHQADPSPIEIEMRQGSDANSDLGATVAITLKNRDKKTRYVYFRRELLSFEVMGPGGLTHCDPQPDTRAPDRSAFLRLRPGQRMTITSRLIELCPKSTFLHPGFYLVHARFDADEDGEEFNLDAYVGRVATQKPANVRIRTGELFSYEKQAMRPLLVREASQ